MSKVNSKYSPEFRARATRMLLEHKDEYSSEWAAMKAIAGKLGFTGETLRKWVRQSERYQKFSVSGMKINKSMAHVKSGYN